MIPFTPNKEKIDVKPVLSVLQGSLASSRRLRKVTLAALIFVTVIATRPIMAAGPQIHKEKVTNKANQARNELHVTVGQTVTGTFSAKPFPNAKLTPGNGGKEMDFDGATVQPSGSADVTWTNAFVMDTILEFYWTQDGVKQETGTVTAGSFQVDEAAGGTTNVFYNNPSDLPVGYFDLCNPRQRRFGEVSFGAQGEMGVFPSYLWAVLQSRS